jgi:hypothetical protein
VSLTSRLSSFVPPTMPVASLALSVVPRPTA